jgi:phosphoenolpyruvate---glycerone phosphotransferase subunit DhaL
VFGTLLITLGKELPPQPAPHDVALALRRGIEALTRLGKAEVGQKTLLDVLDPVQKLLESGLNSSSAELLESVKQCAHDSAQATAHMDATRGRSSFLGDRAKGHVDPGSRSMALIMGSVCDGLSN